MIKKVLIANRAEIALRVIKTCKEMGIKTVSLYTEEEKTLPQRFEADETVYLPGNSLAQTYLNAQRIVEIAKEYNCDGIHPGYGFLSENAQFSKMVTDAGINFIGPRPDSIILMGDKKGSKEKMIEIGIPCIPGYHGDNQDADFLKEQASQIGYPVLIKASAGGGGKGMRVVYDENNFLEELASCKREGQNSFGSDIVLVEKFIENPRHIEVQVMSDNFGNHLHLFERECSIQRRHQKIVEETPSMALDEKLRNNITATAAKISKEINYSGAGTVEFILDGQNYYFLEMNTRLQVEHPITEMVTGLDLVKMQIEVASNEKIDLKQEDIRQDGHAIELRIYAEDPDNNFMPSIGRISKIGTVEEGVRLDMGYEDGDEITVNFDPMIAKLIVHAPNRTSAVNKISSALHRLPFFGLNTNRSYLLRILDHKKFLEGETYTHFVKTYEDDLRPIEVTELNTAFAIGANILNDKELCSKFSSKKSWENLTGFRNI